MTMKASLKGKYKGRETIHTPAGDFDCIKIYTEQKGKVMFISETEYSIDWYAKNIGLVKSETITKKGESHINHPSICHKRIVPLSV